MHQPHVLCCAHALIQVATCVTRCVKGRDSSTDRGSGGEGARPPTIRELHREPVWLELEVLDEVDERADFDVADLDHLGEDETLRVRRGLEEDSGRGGAGAPGEQLRPQLVLTFSTSVKEESMAGKEMGERDDL